MKTKLLLIFALACFTFADAQFTLDSFSHLQSTYNIQVHAMDTDAIGNIYITGEFRGTVNFAPGTTTPVEITSNNGATNGGNHDQPFIAKYDQNLNLIWAKEIFSNSYNIKSVKGYTISVNDAGKSVVTGSTNLERFFFVFDEAGTQQWYYVSRLFGNENNFHIHGATIANDNIIYVYGMADSPNTNSLPIQIFESNNTVNSYINIFPLHIGKNAFIWKFNYTYNNQIPFLSYSFENTPLYINDLVVENADIYTVGKASSHNQNTAFGQLLMHPDDINNTSEYAFLMKMNTSLTGQWLRSIGTIAMNESAEKLFVDTNGIYLTGTSSEHNSPSFLSSDFVMSVRGQNFNFDAAYKSIKTFTMKFDLSGTPQFGKVLYGDDVNTSITPTDITADASNIYVSGIFNGSKIFQIGNNASPFNPNGNNPITFTSIGNHDAFLTTVSQTGVYQGTGIIGASDDEKITAIKNLGAHILTCGFFSNTIDIDLSGGSQNITSSNNQNSFLTKSTAVTLSNTQQDDTDEYIIVFPNPADDFIQVKTTHNKLLERIDVYDVLGKKVASSTTKIVDVSKLNNGIYTLKIVYNNKIISMKIIKR